MSELKRFQVSVQLMGERQEVPVLAATIDEALALADAEYGEDNVYRIRPEVAQ